MWAMIRLTRLALLWLFVTLSVHAKMVDVRTLGATGDGKTLDTDAVNKAIDQANQNGGGTVYFPAGKYACYSIHLKSNVAIYLDAGATILAAENPIDPAAPGYDAPEPNEFDPYEDFGHSHFHNSLIWGENLENVSIIGPGKIDGSGLTTGENPRNKKGEEKQVVEPPKANRATTKFGYPSPVDTLPAGIGNKAIALKNCRNVTFKDFTMYRGGHFAILCTGVDNWTMDNLKIDTNRDGVDLDACRNVRMSNCTVNSPGDDGICLKSSFALGEARATENVTITNCQVSGWECGSLLDGTYRKGKGPGTGRIKFGTESNGGFKNITISNCVFNYCCGLALETVDGGFLEDVTITNITMRDIANSPIFLRLGARLRGPEGTQFGELRRVTISNIECWNASGSLPSIISGIPGHDIEDIRISNIRVHTKGGGTKEQATTKPAENEKKYPEPSMFGQMPSYGFYIRHAKGIELTDVKLSYEKTDERPPIVLDDVKEFEATRVKAQHETGVEEVVK
jgi:polygalacturonase